MNSSKMKSRYINKSFLLWPIGTLILYSLFRNLLYENWLPKLWNFLNITEGVWFDVSISLIAIVCLMAGWESKKRHYSSRHIGLLLSIILLTMLFYWDNDSIPYLRHLGLIPCWFVLLGSYLIGITAHLLYDEIIPLFHKGVEKEKYPAVYLFQDTPVNKPYNDDLAYNSLVRRIVSAINNNTWKESFSIGVTGSWGTGKSTILLFVKDLIKKQDDIIIIEFNPRQSSTIQDIQKDFLSQLAEVLGRYHSGAVRIAHRYMQAIGALPNSLWVARLFGILSDVDIEQRRESIVEVIEQIGKKIVVLIDDFDRLSGEEIQEVLKLIDKNAAFPRTFFVTAYDKMKTNLVISSYMGHVANEDTVDYTDKFFNIEVSLPNRRRSNYVKVLRKCLYTLTDNKIIRFERKEIDEALPKMFPLISKSLPTIRDIKRYVNLLSLTLPLVEDDVLLEDFLLVTLIRYKHPEEYKKLSMYGYVVRDEGKIPESKCLKLNVGSFEKVASADILKSLFTGKEPKYKSVSHVNSFTNYFYDIDSGHLPYRKLVGLLNPTITPEEFKTTVEDLLNNDNGKSDIVEFVLSYENNIHNEQEASWYFRFFLLTRTYSGTKDLYIATLSYLLKDNVQKNVKLFGFDDERAYIGFQKAVLNDRFEYWLSIKCLHDVLHAVTMLDSGDIPEFIFSYEELKMFALRKMEKAISEISDKESSLDIVYMALKACVCEYIPEPGPGESIMPEAVRMVKEAISSNPDFFFKGFLSHRKDLKRSSTIQFYIDEKIPYKDLFKSIADFNSFIGDVIKVRGNNSTLLCLSQFAELGDVQKTWIPSLHITGDISSIKQHDYKMYNQLFEGESTYA